MGDRRPESGSFDGGAAANKARADGGVSSGGSGFYLMGQKIEVNAGIDDSGVLDMDWETGSCEDTVAEPSGKGSDLGSGGEEKVVIDGDSGLAAELSNESKGNIDVELRSSLDEEDEARSRKIVSQVRNQENDLFSSQEAEEESRRRKGKRKIDGEYEQGIGSGTEIKKENDDYGFFQKLFDPEEQAIAFQYLLDVVEAGAQKFKDKGKDILVQNDSVTSNDDDDADDDDNGDYGVELDLPFQWGRERDRQVKWIYLIQLKRQIEAEKKREDRRAAVAFAAEVAKEKEAEKRRENDHVAAAEVRSKRDDEDWPVPFKTAIKIVEDRAKKIVPVAGSSVDKSKGTPMIWTPKRKQDQEDPPKRLVPSLLELCVKGLTKYADAIVSLELVPNALRHWLSSLMCCSRTMSTHFFKLLLQGSPTEIGIQDCSWLTEEQFANSLQGFDPSNLRVLQLDLCGKCLPDYVVLATLAQSPNSMPALTTLSLTGACRLSDVGLEALVSSAPTIRSINLSQCSFLTSSSLDSLANSLGSSLRELYIDDCLGIDPMVTLPALKKLEQLEVLSLAGIEKVSDDFITQFIKDRGSNMKKLVLSGCINLTDSSLKVIAETCYQLSAIDLTKLSNLTDNALAYLAGGCHTIETLKLCRNQFSDEGLAAFLESSGELLKELWLNNVKKVGHNTALSLARHSSRLRILDLSWCRNLTDEDLGLIVDNCLSIRLLKIFGCTQITDVFFDGHSNPNVKIVGRPLSNVQDHIMVSDPLDEVHHFSLPSSI